MLEDQKTVVTALLKDNRHLVAALRDALLVREELVTREISEVLAEAETQQRALVDITAD